MFHNYNFIFVESLFVMLSSLWFICLALGVLVIVGFWRLFAKAGEPGWACLIPFYSQYVLYKMAFGNGWLFLLLLVPIVNIVLALMLPFKLAKAFGHDIGYGFGLLFLSAIFINIMAFDKHEYIGPATMKC